MKDDLDLPVTLSESIQAVDSLLGIVFLEVLNVSEASALAVLEGLELARANLSELSEQFIQLLLSHLLWKILHNEIGLGVKVTVLLLIQDNSL